MPRKRYSPQNPYVHNSNIPVHTFLMMSQCFISGMSAADTHRTMTKAHEETGEIPLPPSTKTIAKVYRRLGHYLFARLIEPMMPPIGRMKELFPEKHEEYLDHMAGILVKFSLSEMDYSHFI